MRTIKTFTFIFLILIGFENASAQTPDFYQIKFYHIDNPTQEETLDNYFENAYLPALHKAGVESVGVFKPILQEGDSTTFFVVWIPFQSLSDVVNMDEILANDKDYQLAAKDYINAPHQAPPYNRIESILMKAFEYMPQFSIPKHATPAHERVYELRSYQSATEKLYHKKLDMFNSGEIKIFQDLGFQPVFFGDVIAGAETPNLIYMTTFANRQSRDEHWKAFSASPAWDKLKSIEKYKNTVSAIDKYFLYPTDYSDF